MATNKLQWKRITKGDRLPCQSFLRKKDGEILKLSTVGGVKVGQDCYYLPVDDVIEEIKNYPIEESEDEKIRKMLIEFFRDWGKTRSHCWSIFIPDILAWLEKQGEQKSIEWSKEDRETIDYLIDYLESELDSSYTKEDKEEFTKEIELLKSLRPQSTWKPTEQQMKVLNEVINFAADHGTMRWNDYIYKVLKGLREQLNKL